MEYGDPFQFFGLAPWHGVPFRLTRNPGASLGIQNAIPILDVVGFRYQWGSGRSTSIRAGLGLMYFQDEDVVRMQMPSSGAGGMSAVTESVFNFAIEANVSWTGLIVGAGYVTNDRSYAGKADWARFRLIVGADLLKVFGNRWAEAL
jgi:hypothetical protein